jgi:hypothetical protein
MGNDNQVVVSHKVFGFQGRVVGHIVVMEPVVVVPKFQFFSAHFLSSISKHTVKVRVDRSVRRNKFMVNNPFNVEENNQHALC